MTLEEALKLPEPYDDLYGDDRYVVLPVRYTGGAAIHHWREINYVVVNPMTRDWINVYLNKDASMEQIKGWFNVALPTPLNRLSDFCSESNCWHAFSLEELLAYHLAGDVHMADGTVGGC